MAKCKRKKNPHLYLALLLTHSCQDINIYYFHLSQDNNIFNGNYCKNGSQPDEMSHLEAVALTEALGAIARKSAVRSLTIRLLTTSGG